MTCLSIRNTVFVALASAAFAAPAAAQSFGVDFVADYTFTDLGTPTGVPGPLGGINFKAGDVNTILIGGSANNAGGVIHEIGVTRDGAGHITGFSGTSVLAMTAPNIDGGVAFGPTGVLFVTTYSNNQLHQFLPGSTMPDRTDMLTPLGISSSVGTCNFVPNGFGGAGTFKVVSYNSSDWYDVVLSPDGSGTFDLTSAAQTVNSGGGPEGFVYVAGGNPGFMVDSVIVSEYSAGQVRVYDIDGNGDPIPATQREFLTGLSGAEGAVIDPVTGDFIFSTFGGGDRVIVVQGFDAPAVFCAGKLNSQGCEPTMSFTGSPTLTGPDDFVVSCSNALNEAFGILMFSSTPGNQAYGGGTLCLTGQMIRLPIQSSGGTTGSPGSDCTGTFSDALTQSWMTSSGFVAGNTVFLQYISRDGGFAVGQNLSLSEGLRFTVQP